jgi:hypothetical protein
MMVMVKHEEIEHFLGDMPFATVPVRPDEPIDHLDQRGGADNRVELLKHPGLYGLKVVLKEPIGDSEPLLALTVVVMLVLAVRLMPQMMMVPGENQRI